MYSQNLRLVDERFGDGPRYYLTEPKDIDMRVPDQISKCVLFVGMPELEPEPYHGTSYIVTVPGRNQNHFAFLVTARHVAEKLQGKNFYIRANKRNGGMAELRGLADNPWWYHPTERESVDCAVTLFAPSQIRELDVEHIPIDLFLDDQKTKEHNVGVGDDVFIAGLFTKVADTSRNIPIVRTGNVAMIPGEEIYFHDRFIAANLIESRSIGGLSGSPVFVRPTLQMKIGEEDGQPVIANAPGRIFFFGSVIGHWEVPSEDFKITVAEAVNMGIAPVVPAQKIREVIMQPALEEIMKNIDNEMRVQNQRGARLDFAPSEKGETQITDGGATIPVPTAEKFFDVVKKASRKIKPDKK
jgi:hypothetical protein